MRFINKYNYTKTLLTLFAIIFGAFLETHVSPSQKDGLHLEPESHKKIAEVLSSKIQSLNLQ